jgi:hypothetical protein
VRAAPLNVMVTVVTPLAAAGLYQTAYLDVKVDEMLSFSKILSSLNAFEISNTQKQETE